VLEIRKIRSIRKGRPILAEHRKKVMHYKYTIFTDETGEESQGTAVCISLEEMIVRSRA